ILDAVTSIGKYAFLHCDSLTEINVDKNNKSYASIDGILFNKDITELIQYPIGNTRTSYTIPDSITSIGCAAFNDCTSLTEITIPNSVTIIDSYAFESCTSLTEITIPDGVTSIGDGAFQYCTLLTEITIPDSVTSIGGWAFQYCISLESVTIPDKITSISSMVFNDCTSLTEVIISNSVTSIKSCAFADCTSLESIVIPDSVTSIGSEAFSGCTSLTEVVIPNSITSIGSGAFEYCTSLTEITIPDSVTTIGNWAFRECTSINVDENNKNYASIDGVLFNKDITVLIQYPTGNTRTSYTIPDSVTEIRNWAFEYCKSLNNIIMPNSVTKIWGYAFYGCTSLTDVYYNGTEEEWSSIDIVSYNEPLTNATIHFIDEDDTDQDDTSQDNTMVFGQDNWNFTNSSKYFGASGSKIYLSYEDKNTLFSSLTNTERTKATYLLSSTWGGSCYGMSVTEILAKIGVFDVNAWDSSAYVLNDLPALDPAENSAQESMINYYHVLQITDLIQQEIANTISNRDNYDVVAELLDMVSEVENGGNPVLVCYQGNGWGHAVVAYGVEDETNVINGTEYDKKILIMDPNFANNFNEEACIYVNSEDNSWCIPYSNYNLNSNNRYSKISLVTNDLTLLNNKGYFDSTEVSSTSNEYISILEFNYNTDFTICKTVESISGNWINSTEDEDPAGEIFYSFFTSEDTDNPTAKMTLKDSLSGYSYSLNSPDEMDLNMSYENCYLVLNADNSYEVKFAPDGFIEMNGENSDYSMNMVFNEGYYTLPWSNIQVDGENTDTISMNKTDDGIVISGDNLNDVKVSALNDSVYTKVNFSTGYDETLVCALDDYTIGIKVDADDNGTFETLIAQSKSYSKVKNYSIMGDINSDNQVSAIDLLLIKRYILDIGVDLTETLQADVNEDNSINLLDLLELKKYIAE
ncbi:MAG: leucine-rich repeat protein, partial [Ruminococcus sp.]|nr:leucine-rich repeat protein [Ruminococcus sp.]